MEKLLITSLLTFSSAAFANSRSEDLAKLTAQAKDVFFMQEEIAKFAAQPSTWTLKGDTTCQISELETLKCDARYAAFITPTSEPDQIYSHAEFEITDANDLGPALNEIKVWVYHGPAPI